MNINPNKIYATHRDDSGHTYLIPYQESLDVFKEIAKLEKNIIYNQDCPETYWAYVDELNDFLESFDRLEGESYYVILEEDLEG